MTICSGTRLGPYEILAPIGAGGMGEVFKARDTRLERIVAIKILPEEVARDESRRSRLQREAKIVSQLNHPHICTLHDTGSEDGIDFLVMEHLEGHSLADRLTRGALPLAEVVRIGIEIAEALQRAHEEHIVHRDLKPSNVMLTKSGVKLLDFGLAKFADGSESVTADGAVAGTPRYMAPEQIGGQRCDHRADIFALGCVLYEMRTGKPALGGVQRVTPPELEHVIAKCLEEDPDQRWQSAWDIAEQLRWIGGTGHRNRWKWIAPIAVTSVAVAALAGWMVFSRLNRPQTAPLRATFTRLTDDAGSEEFPAISPDGKLLVYTSSAAGKPDIYLQRIGGHKTVNLTADSKTDNGMPAFSPDGQSIAFRSGRDGGGIFVMGATGESVRRVSDFGFNPAWSPDGKEIAVSTRIAVGNPYTPAARAELWRIEIEAGRKHRVYEGDALNPTWSPHGRRIAFCRSNLAKIVSIPSDGGRVTPVTSGPSRDWAPVWSGDGHIYFSSNRGGTINLWRIAVDEETGAAGGAPEPLTTPSLWSGPLSISADGKRIVYCARHPESNLLFVSFDPVRETLIGNIGEIPLGNYINNLDVSPDGQWIAFCTLFEQEDIYVVRTDGSELRRLTDDIFMDAGPRWSPDGKRIAFASTRLGVTARPETPSQIWSINPDGSGLQQLTDLDGGASGPPLWSPDGRRLFVRSKGKSSQCLVDLTGPLPARTAEDVPLPLIQEGFQYTSQSWSPDGKWIAVKAWSSDMKIRKVFVYSVESRSHRAFPQSLNAVAATAAWMSDSRRVLLLDGDRLSVVDSRTSATHEIFSFRFFAPAAALSKDDRRLYLVRSTNAADIWMADLQ